MLKLAFWQFLVILCMCYKYVVAMAVFRDGNTNYMILAIYGYLNSWWNFVFIKWKGIKILVRFAKIIDMRKRYVYGSV